MRVVPLNANAEFESSRLLAFALERWAGCILSWAFSVRTGA